MKKIIFTFVFIVPALLFTACTGSREESRTETVSDETKQHSDVDGKILVAYFSWADNAVQDNSIDAVTSPSVTVPGNVAQLAEWICEETEGDIFPIRVAEPYPSDWDGCLSRANEEKSDGIHPQLLETMEGIDGYDTVFLGFPNWWYSCPMAIFSFLDNYGFEGKQVYLFCSHGSGGLAGSVKDITDALPDAAVSEDVFHVYEDDTASAKDDIHDWLERLDY